MCLWFVVLIWCSLVGLWEGFCLEGKMKNICQDKEKDQSFGAVAHFLIFGWF